MKAKEILLKMATKEDLLIACNLRANSSLLIGRILGAPRSDLPYNIALCEDISAEDLIKAAQ